MTTIHDICLDMFVNWMADPDTKVGDFAPQLGEALKELDYSKYEEAVISGMKLGQERLLRDRRS